PDFVSRISLTLRRVNGFTLYNRVQTRILGKFATRAGDLRNTIRLMWYFLDSEAKYQWEGFAKALYNIFAYIQLDDKIPPESQLLDIRHKLCHVDRKCKALQSRMEKGADYMKTHSNW
ncbi:2975_t:CDS:1, partial [Acaulospora colombiana]